MPAATDSTMGHLPATKSTWPAAAPGERPPRDRASGPGCRRRVEVTRRSKLPLRADDEATPFPIVRDSEGVRQPLAPLTLRDDVETAKPNFAGRGVVQADSDVLRVGLEHDLQIGEITGWNHASDPVLSMGEKEKSVPGL